MELRAAVVPFLVAGNDITVQGIEMTSDQPYPVEFVQLAGTNHRLLDCVIHGPPQSGPSTGWVVNRGFVPQPGTTNLLVRDNIFHTLRQGAYLNPGATGYIQNNACYNTRGYVVDGASFVFTGNSWGLPANAVDIALLTGTPAGPPYDPLTELAASNSQATIDDQR